MILNKEYIKHYRTKNGGWTRSQLEAVGVSWPPVKGWIDRVAGTYISDHQQKVFESNGNTTTKNS